MQLCEILARSSSPTPYSWGLSALPLINRNGFIGGGGRALNMKGATQPQTFFFRGGGGTQTLCQTKIHQLVLYIAPFPPKSSSTKV